MNLNELGTRALNDGNYQEAVNIFRRSLEKKRDAAAQLGLAMAYEMLGETKPARFEFQQVLALDPENENARAALEKPAPEARRTSPEKSAALFRTADAYFEIRRQGQWKKIFFKAINLGLGLPGFFPGDYPIGKQTYGKWFQQISDLGVNAIRIYTIHPPSFYEAFRQFNESALKLYLFQGIWAELPDDNDFGSTAYRLVVQESIKKAVDVVYGNAFIPDGPGVASGVFDQDVSRYTAGFIFGREWESCAVKGYNESRGRKPGHYQGAFLRITKGTPFEVWLTKTCDFLQTYEYNNYRGTHPVSTVNWPTLDPLSHPSESRYEDEQLFQGQFVDAETCSENDDEESVDLAKIASSRGGGFFATYHAYPYYPDFMNNDYLVEENPYLAYLRVLKRHHGRQPVVIAEFGVPSSRDISHWHRNGWHHGGHSEARQGEINGLLMQSIHSAGLAGGVLFSWFDEWFKQSWVFAPYEIPADRNSLWFNFQDAEQNYGLLAAYPGYPGKRVTLSGLREEWSEAVVLYEKEGAEPVHAFRDGHDDTRTLVRLAAQHDEGFFYILLEAKGNIDFAQAHYLVGLDTVASDAGESLMPLRTRFRTPVGLKFLIHLAGESNSRILVCRSYDKYLNVEDDVIRPVASDQGEWVIMQNRTNNRRISKDKKKFYPSRVFSMSNLKYGSLDPNDPRHDTLSDFCVHANRIELRIPWGLINVTDPSSRSVLWMEGNGRTKKTGGIGVLAATYKPEQGLLHARDTGREHNLADFLPARMARETIRQYTWEEYTTPVYHSYLKESYGIYKKILSAIPETIR